ncbi:MAG: hypothetical protein U5K55_06225 [Aliarcobacter sp.]|nr:hypothetical protein [Aliarcobacter sp.]
MIEKNENISDNKPENTFISTIAGGNTKDLKQDENKQFSSKLKDTKGLDSTVANVLYQGQNSISNYGINDIQKGIENLNELYTLRMQGNNEVSELDKSINKNPINKGELADVKTQLEYLKDDISEITYINTQPLDKKGNKR